MRYSKNDLLELLGGLDEKIVRLEAELGAARAQRSGAVIFIESLPDDEDTQADLPTDVTVTDETAPTVRTIKHSRRAPAIGTTALVFQIISEHPDGVHIQDIGAAADERGQQLDPEQVRSAVTYLRRRGDAENISRGVWKLKDDTSPTNAEGPTDAAGPSEQDPSPLTLEAASG